MRLLDGKYCTYICVMFVCCADDVREPILDLILEVLLVLVSEVSEATAEHNCA
jgi:hypothetical protein